MQIKLFYKQLPANQDPSPILAELENEVNKWLARVSNPSRVMTQTTYPDGGILITVTY